MAPTAIFCDNCIKWLFYIVSCRFLVLMGRMMQTNLKWNSRKGYLSCTRENSVKHLLQLDQEIIKKDVCILWDYMCVLSIKDHKDFSAGLFIA